MEKKFKDFLALYKDKFVERVDATNKNQCFDLVVAWCEWLGFPKLFPHLYAYQIYTVDTDDKNKYFTKIENSSTAYPQAGDIVVWSKSYNGTAGHTAVATGNHKTEGKSTDWFEAFSQNDPIGSPCVLKTYKYTNVLGWLRPKPELIKFDNYYKGIDLSNTESVKVCVDTWYDVAVQGLYVKKEEMESKLKEKDNTIANLNQQINDLNAKNTTINDERNRLADSSQVCLSSLKEKEEQYNTLIKETDELRQEKIELRKLKANWELKEIDYQKRIKYLETRLQGFKTPMKTLIVDIWQKVVKV